MKMIKISTVSIYEIRAGYYVQPMSQGVAYQQTLQNSQQNQSGGVLQGFQNYQGLAQQQLAQQNASQNQTYYQTPIQTITEVSLPIDSISHIDHTKTDSYSSIVHLKHKAEPLYAKETAEQIEKLIHNSEFNSKMDDILA